MGGGGGVGDMNLMYVFAKSSEDCISTMVKAWGLIGGYKIKSIKQPAEKQLSISCFE